MPIPFARPAAAAVAFVSSVVAGPLMADLPAQPESDMALPRHATVAEAAQEALRPRIADRGPGTSPIGAVVCPGEYAPNEGVILSYHPSYSSAVLAIVRQMAVAITTTGQGRASIVFSSTASRDATLPVLQAAGADMSRVVPIVSSLNSIWMRDYGPRYIYEGGQTPGGTGAVRAIVDHTYNRTTRTIDNAFPIVFSNLRRHQLYTLPLIHGGGNYHLDSVGRGHATRLIVNENPTLTESQIIGLWQQYQNVVTTMYQPFPVTVDATQHIDMWTQVLADDKVMISEWTANRGSTQDTICENAATTVFPGMGYQVFRVPARSIGSVHYTYTNVVMCNNLVLIPSYTNASVSPLNAAALASFQAALPGKSIVPIDCQAIVGLAGVMHCICMHVPEHKGVRDAVGGGVAPTVLLRTPQGGPGVSYSPGQFIDIRWMSDDDNAVVNVDLQLSFDSGATWPVTILAAGADDSQQSYLVPNYFSRQARIRVVARDAEGRTASAASAADFTLAGMCRADINNSLTLTVQDIFDYLGVYFAPSPAADFNDSGEVTVQDLFDFLAAYFAGCA